MFINVKLDSDYLTMSELTMSELTKEISLIVKDSFDE